MALRELLDSRGVAWMVFAVRPSVSLRATGGTRPELAAGWLCIQSSDLRRRLPGIPDGRESWTDERLLALLPAEVDDAPVRRSR